jgi:tRNA dimethylallyltransferase
VSIPVVFQDAFVLTGPTGSGKSAVALPLAELLDAEILCMDSMTVYRGMDLGTAKPSAAERRRVPHHVLDLLEPWEKATVAWWLQQAQEAAADIQRRGKSILIVGGTPLYLKALLHGIFPGPAADPALRAELEQRPTQELHVRLQNIDPQAAARIHSNDQKRLVRALEVFQLTGQPISSWQCQFDQPSNRLRSTLWLDWPRALLYERIERRVDAMLADGWLEEVRRLNALPRPMSKEASQAAGYRELAEHLAGQLSYDQAVAQTKTRTRQLAKRQLTWLRNLPGMHPLPMAPGQEPRETAERCLESWQAARRQ